MPLSLYESRPSGSFSAGMPNRIMPPRPELRRLAGFFGDQIDRKLGMARHRADRLPHALSRPGEQRQNQLGRVELRLAARSLRTAGW